MTHLWITIAVLLCGLLPPLRVAQAESDGSARPSVQIVWTETPPVIDGVLDDPAWQDAARVTDFTMVIPDPGGKPTQRTEVRLLTDRSNLYVYIRCWDDYPEGIIANRNERDDITFYDDRVQVAIDTFHDHQNGYLFEVNANGVRRDVLIESDEFAISWDTIWYNGARIDEDGWTAEIAIPYQSISFDPESDTWGLNLARGIRRNNEEMRWADPAPQRFASSFGKAGVLSGMRGIGSGLGLDVVPALTLRHIDDPIADDEKFQADPSGDVYYKLTPSLTASFTANTNFGETEADERRINNSRFALSFPEKRDFFLQDTLIFNFGELLDRNRATPLNGLPFFSRNLGIAQTSSDPTAPLFESGEILYGGKVTGRVGRFKVGVLHTLVDDIGGVGRQHLSVARAAMNIFEESTIGLIGTYGDPSGTTNNGVVGADFRLKRSDFRGDQTVRAIGWFQHSISDEASDQDYAYGLRLEYPNDKVNLALAITELADGFDPKLGFVNRPDVRDYEFVSRYRWRQTGYIRTIDSASRFALTTDRDNEIESSTIELTPLKFENELAGKVELNVRHRYEEPRVPFFLPGPQLVSADGHHFFEAKLNLNASTNRRWRADMTLEGGQFFDGERIVVVPYLEFRPTKQWLFGARYTLYKAWFPGQGSATTHTVRAEVGYFLTSQISWKTLVQYDNVTESIGINSRIRWIVEDGKEIFIVFNQDLVDDGDGDLRRGRSEPLVKVAWTLRF